MSDGVRDVADERREADRGEHGREREQHGQPGGDERAEGEQQDQEGQRHRQALGVREVLADRVVEGAIRARLAELRDPEARGAPAAPPRRRRARADTRSSAVSPWPFRSNWTSARVPVLRRTGGLERSSPRAAARARSSHACMRGGTPGERPFAALRLRRARSRRPGGRSRRRRGSAPRARSRRSPARRRSAASCPTTEPSSDRGDDEREPAEGRGLPVRGAPAAGARRDVVVACHGVSLPVVVAHGFQADAGGPARQWRLPASRYGGSTRIRRPAAAKL